jgi:hypothetical protein
MATKKIFTNLVSNGKVDANEFRPGDGTNGRFYSDSAGRMAFDSGQVYIKSGVGTYYNYAANQYHGSTTGTNHRFRGNYITANNWGIDTTGNITGNSFIKSGGTASQFLKANGTVDNSVYITGYTETDTLDTVADRGNTTNQTLKSTNSLGFRVDSAGDARVEIDAGGTNWAYLRLMDSGATAWDIGTYDGGNLEWRPGGSQTNKMTYTSAGILTTGDGFTSTKGNSAFSWGDHALAGYLTSASTQSKYIRSDVDDSTSGNLTMSKTFPKLILDSPGSGDNWTSQGAQISLGESGAGSASLHLTYNGGGIGHIGMGALSGTGVPSFSAIRFNYAANAIYFYSNPSIAGSTNWHSGNDGASSGLDSDKLDGQHGTYYLDYNNFTNTPVIPDISSLVDGSGTGGRITKWTDSNSLGNSIMYEVSNKIGIGVASPKAALHVNGAVIVGNDTTAASADLAGALRYWDEQTGGTVTSYVDMCMKSACGYSWVNIVTNRTQCV